MSKEYTLEDFATTEKAQQIARQLIQSEHNCYSAVNLVIVDDEDTQVFSTDAMSLSIVVQKKAGKVKDVKYIEWPENQM